MNNDYTKEFDLWNEYAKKLNAREHPEAYNVKEVWWCALGVNIGSEQDGKNESFERPVLIIKRISKDMLIVSPITSSATKHRYRLTINLLGKESQILILHTKIISAKRLLRRISLIKNYTYVKVILSIISMYAVIDSNEGETPQ